ncbi:hypothetical protein [Nicoliella lavandulae]|uniref:Extracellular protein n=1 Tax=Nicoliella lavandulae TaxID=3082954 RepID=A0ABU8SIU9_9LACO
MKLKKTLLVSLLAASLAAPVAYGVINDGQNQVTVNAAKHHKKKTTKKKAAKKTTKKHHKKAKHAKKTTTTTTTTTTTSSSATSAQPEVKKTAVQTQTTTTTSTPATTQATSSVNAAQVYNNAVASLGQYANPGNMTSYTVGDGTRFNDSDVNQNIKNAINDMVNNMGSTDQYDAQNYGNSAVQAFAQQSLALYQGFKGYFSSYDNDNLTSTINAVQQNAVNAKSSSADVNNEWNLIINFLNGLSNAFSKLG